MWCDVSFSGETALKIMCTRCFARTWQYIWLNVNEPKNYRKQFFFSFGFTHSFSFCGVINKIEYPKIDFFTYTWYQYQCLLHSWISTFRDRLRAFQEINKPFRETSVKWIRQSPHKKWVRHVCRYEKWTSNMILVK